MVLYLDSAFDLRSRWLAIRYVLRHGSVPSTVPILIGASVRCLVCRVCSARSASISGRVRPLSIAEHLRQRARQLNSATGCALVMRERQRIAGSRISHRESQTYDTLAGSVR